MTIQTNDTSSEVMLQRIDAIISELQALRQQVLINQSTDISSENLVEELAGSLGQGTWDEYDPDLEWKRFDA